MWIGLKPQPTLCAVTQFYSPKDKLREESMSFALANNLQKQEETKKLKKQERPEVKIFQGSPNPFHVYHRHIIDQQRANHISSNRNICSCLAQRWQSSSCPLSEINDASNLWYFQPICIPSPKYNMMSCFKNGFFSKTFYLIHSRTKLFQNTFIFQGRKWFKKCIQIRLHKKQFQKRWGISRKYLAD